MIVLPDAVAAAAASSSVMAVRCYQIGGNPILYFADTDIDVMFQGQVYTSKGISYSKATTDLGVKIAEHNVVIDNLDNGLIAWALNQDPTGYISQVYKGFSDGTLTEAGQLTLVSDFGALIFRGRNTQITYAAQMELLVKAGLDFYEQIGPKTSQDITCRFKGNDGFKGQNCGYTGDQTSCNYTIARCRDLSNSPRFGGFPALTSSDY